LLRDWKERPDGGFEQEQVAALVLERERQDLAQSAPLAGVSAPRERHEPRADVICFEQPGRVSLGQ
jgi:hypothetical protein